MSTTSKKDPSNDKKSLFWEKLNKKKAAVGGGSLVDAIVRQAEKKAAPESEKIKNKKVDDLSQYIDDSRAKNKARASLGDARTVFGFVVVVAIGLFFYFFMTLDESNYFYKDFGLENLTTEMNRKTKLSEKILTDIRDTKKFGNLIKIEDLASRIVMVDLENVTLNYAAPIGERVVSREDGEASEIFIKTTNDVGEIIYVPESEIRTSEDMREAKIELAISSIEEIIQLVDELRGVVVSEPKIKEDFKNLLAEFKKINLNEIDKDKFPDSVLKSNFAVVQFAATNILREIKSLNLKNLVIDIKNQIQVIDVIGMDEMTQKVVIELQDILMDIRPEQPSTFKNALVQIETAGIGNISNNAIYQKVARIVNDSESTSKYRVADLPTAAMIAQNIGRVNVVGILESERIAWSTVIERIQKIARLGADLERDIDNIPMNENRDLDANGDLISLFSYSGKSEKNEIEIQGEVFAEQNYEQRAFTLLADLIDAIEASEYFRDVDGFIFAKEISRDGEVGAPFNLSLTLQDPSVSDEYDVTKAVIEESSDMDNDWVNLDEVDFSFDKDGNGDK